MNNGAEKPQSIDSASLNAAAAGENCCLHKELLPPIIVICCPEPWNICSLSTIGYTINWGSFPGVLSHHRAIEKPYKVQTLSSGNDSRWWINPIRGRGDITLLATPPTPLKTLLANRPRRGTTYDDTKYDQVGWCSLVESFPKDPTTCLGQPQSFQQRLVWPRSFLWIHGSFLLLPTRQTSVEWQCLQ